MVAEADESDRSFLKLFPTIAVVTNIDHEHLENYGGFDDLLQAFVDFANNVPFYGGVVACADDANLAGIIPRMTRRVTTYGLTGQGCDVTATDIRLKPLGVEAVITRRGRRADGAEAAPPTLGSLRLQVPGRHNLQNALAAVDGRSRARRPVRTNRLRAAGVPRRGAAVRRPRRSRTAS